LRDYWWYIAGTYLLIVNIARAVWLIMTRSWLDILWLSQIIGCVEAAVFFTRTRRPILNGFYTAIALFPFMGVIIFLPLGADVLFWLNHTPHFFLFYFFFHKEKVAMPGFNISMFFMLFQMNLTWYLQYRLGVLSMAINTTTSPYFPLVLGISLVWYIFAYYSFSQKTIQRENEKKKQNLALRTK
jgi:hypothetical protein